MLDLRVEATTLARRLLTVSTREDLDAILAMATDHSWLPLGGVPNNAGIVRIGADPGDALIERVTNGIDALVERAVATTGAVGLDSPRRAAEALFGLPHGRLADVPTSRREELAQNLRVTLRDSGEGKLPTVVVEDRGIGQHPDDFAGTILSLNQENKVVRPDLMGAFGQGGASVYRFAPGGCIFVSRRDAALLKPGQTDEVGWTIVRWNPLDENHKNGRWEYLVVPDDGGAVRVPRFDPSALPPEYADYVGCHFVAVAYQMERYSDVVFHSDRSLWHLLNASLFDPTHPILIRDERAKAVKEDAKRALKGIVVSGNATRLQEDKRDRIDYSNAMALPLGDAGTVVLRYFVLIDRGDAQKNWELMANYVQPDLAVTITLNGQRQGTRRRELFTRTGLLIIGKALIAHVDCDGLSKMARRDLFSATRDRTTDSPLVDEIDKRVQHAILSDKDLRAMDRARKEAALARQSEAETKRINELLKSAISTLKLGPQPVFRKIISSDSRFALLGDQPLIDDTPDTRPISDPPGPDVQLTDPPPVPTELRVLNPNVQVPAGGTGVVRLAMNAPDDYVSPEPGGGTGTFITQFTKGAQLFRLTGYSAVRRGAMRVTVATEKGVPPGESGRLVFAVTRPDGLPLLAEADIHTVEPPRPRVKPAGTKTLPEPGPNVVAVDREGWKAIAPEDALARVEFNPETQETTIYVFRDYNKLLDRLNRERVPEEHLRSYQNKFVAAVALSAWMQEEAHQDAQKKGEPGIDQDARDAELRRAAEVFLFSQFVPREKLDEL